MSFAERVAVLAAVIVLLWVCWPMLRRLLCPHDAWRTVEKVAGFGVPILDQRCDRCGQTRAIYAGRPAARREGP